MSLYDSVRDLPLTIDGYALDGLEQHVSSDFLRKTTADPAARAPERRGSARTSPTTADEHDLQQARGPRAAAARATWTLHTFSQHLATLPLFDHEPEQHAYLDYRRWAFESAALDLALRQAGRPSATPSAARRGR